MSDNYRNGNDHSIRSTSISPTSTTIKFSQNDNKNSSAGCSTNNISNKIDLLVKNNDNNYEQILNDKINLNKTFNNNNQEINLNTQNIEQQQQQSPQQHQQQHNTNIQKRSMDNVLKRLSNKMKSSSLRDERHIDDDNHLRRNSKNSSPPIDKSLTR